MPASGFAQSAHASAILNRGRTIPSKAIRAIMPVPASEAGNDYRPYATNRAPKASNSWPFARLKLLRQIQLPADQQVGFNSMRGLKQGNMPFFRDQCLRAAN